MENTALRFVRSGAAHLPLRDAKALARVFNCTVLPTYSMSECMPVCAVPLTFDVLGADAVDTVGPPIG